MVAPAYTTREQVAAASDVKASAYLNDKIDRLIFQVSRTIEATLHRSFYPTIATKAIEWPERGSFWLDDDLLSVTTLSIDGTAVTGYVLEDQFFGAPYNRIDFDDATRSGGEDISIAGVWGFSNEESAAGTLAVAISSASATTLTVSNAAAIGIGDQIKIDSERMVVTGRASADTGTTLGSNIDAQTSVTTVPVASGAAINMGETILIDSERMKVLDIAGNNLIVKRAVDGSVLASHTSSATVYASRLLTVSRGNAGTTAATHSQSAAITKNVPPGLINELALAEVQYLMGQEDAAWNLTIGEGEGQRESSGKSIAGIRKQASLLYGRRRYAAV